ncbi:AP2-like ethylene-responsive transcription factor PLT2 [Salvia miltiorrhiza]|uniref:AP2-like ethylene-responsive transcription factor PLT2 n=1 Tax=Salvia miltiorrhiza TaxID=226208 RepID=UPI0025AC1819|nr:AP2-like ethylene-responsive transcription factor PLT2 [Salvia miltiorrhiza]
MVASSSTFCAKSLETKFLTLCLELFNTPDFSNGVNFALCSADSRVGRNNINAVAYTLGNEIAEFSRFQNVSIRRGSLGTEEEAAEAYDIAAIKFGGLNAVTNFEINRYDVKSILESTTLPIGAAKRLRRQEEMVLNLRWANESSLNLATYAKPNGGHMSWPNIAFQQAQPLVGAAYPYNHQHLWCKPELDSEINHGLHNFLQPSSVLHNIMTVDSSNMEHGYGSTAVMSGTTITVIISVSYWL